MGARCTVLVAAASLLTCPFPLVYDDPQEGDGDSRLGASSMQVFEGEDLANAPRLKSQAAQQRAWLQDQINEKQGRMLDEQAYERYVAGSICAVAAPARDEGLSVGSRVRQYLTAAPRGGRI